MTSYISLLNKIEAFCNAHLQIKKYKGEFKEQMPNFSTMNEKYPIVFIVPTSDSETLELNQFTLDIYCVDIIQKDRANLNTIVSDCHLILKDLYLYFKDGSDLSVDVIADPTMTPLNNFDLDYVAGWVMTITFEVEGYSICAIPMNPIPPFTPTCEDATVENSDESYTATVASGGTLVLPDITVTDSDGSSSSFPSAKNVTCTPSITRSTATLMKTGQTTVYRTGDDADTSANGRAVDFFTLDTAPVHNNGSATINTTTNRFTDTLGGQSFANDIVLDWSTWNGSTLLGWDRRVNGGGANTDKTWNNAIDEAAAHSVGSFVSGWRCCNRMEAMSICNDDFIATWLNYAPFNYNAAQGFWISSTIAIATTTATFFFPNGRTIVSAGKTVNAALRWMACRTFSLSTLNVLS